MPRVRFSETTGGARAFTDHIVERPVRGTPGYTPIMLLTEWLTLNCRSDWAMRADGKVVLLRFASLADRDRAAAELGAVT
jgi:hypothetical protein